MLKALSACSAPPSCPLPRPRLSRKAASRRNARRAPRFRHRPGSRSAGLRPNFAEAEKLVQVTDSAAHRAQAAENWQRSMAGLYERRTGPRKVELPDAGAPAPAAVWNPLLPGQHLVASAKGDSFEPLPAPHPPAAQSRRRHRFRHRARARRLDQEPKLSCRRLATIYLERLERYTKELHCVITLTADLAREQALRADAMLAFGNYLGPLHGIPWGAKDLLDTAASAPPTARLHFLIACRRTTPLWCNGCMTQGQCWLRSSRLARLR